MKQNTWNKSLKIESYTKQGQTFMFGEKQNSKRKSSQLKSKLEGTMKNIKKYLSLSMKIRLAIDFQLLTIM